MKNTKCVIVGALGGLLEAFWGPLRGLLGYGFRNWLLYKLMVFILLLYQARECWAVASKLLCQPMPGSLDEVDLTGVGIRGGQTAAWHWLALGIPCRASKAFFPKRRFTSWGPSFESIIGSYPPGFPPYAFLVFLARNPKISAFHQPSSAEPLTFCEWLPQKTWF